MGWKDTWLGIISEIWNWEENYERFIFTIQIYWRRSLLNAAMDLFIFEGRKTRFT